MNLKKNIKSLKLLKKIYKVNFQDNLKKFFNKLLLEKKIKRKKLSNKLISEKIESDSKSKTLNKFANELNRYLNKSLKGYKSLKSSVSKKKLSEIRNIDFKNLNHDNGLLILYISISALTSLLIFLFLSLPIGSSNSKIKEEIDLAKTKKSQLSKLVLTKNKLQEKQLILQNDKDFLINLIGGNTNLSTFLSIIQIKANFHSVEILNIEPLKVQKYIDKNNLELNDNSQNNLSSNQNDSSPEINNSLMTPELKQHLIDLSIKGSFINILNLIRDLESLENIVLAGDSKFIRLLSTSEEPVSEIKYTTQISIFGKI